MVNRIQMIPQGMKVSKGGFDVTTAAKGQLIFDSEWAHTKVWIRGSGVWGGPDVQSRSKTFSVYYGKTFSRPPMGVASISNYSTASWAANYREAYIWGGDREYWWGAGARFFNDRVEFWQTAEDPYDYIPSLTFEYTILDFTL